MIFYNSTRTRPVRVTSALVVRITQRHAVPAILARVQLAWFDLFIAKTTGVSVLAFALVTVDAGQQAFAENAIAQIAIGQRTERPCDQIRRGEHVNVVT